MVYRSPIAHGKILSLDLNAALSSDDVLAIYTQRDLDNLGIRPLRCRTPISATNQTLMIEPERPVLARDEVKYVGQPIAFVVARNEHAAISASERIKVKFQEMPVIKDSGISVLPDAPIIWPQAPNNVSFCWELGNLEDTDAAIRKAGHVIQLRVQHPRIVINPIEPRGAIATYHPSENRWTLMTPSQGTVLLRSALADILDCKEQQLRVITPEVGGSFAVKIWPYPEQVLCLVATRDIRRPVKWTATRSEMFFCDAQGRGRIDNATLALDTNGRFLAFRIEADGDLGAYINTVSPSIFTSGACRTFGHNYKIPALHYKVRAVFTNAPPTDAYRGAGKPETVATLERIIDYAADILEIDKIELRRKNLIGPSDIPYRTPMGEEIDAGNFPLILNQALSLADWSGYGIRESDTQKKGRLRGRAAGVHLHASGGSVAERTQVRALSDGTIRVLTSSQDSGQGHRSTLAIIVSEALGISIDRIKIKQGDSDLILKGGSTGGSNLLPVTANTVHRSALAMIDRARHLSADILETAVEDIEYESGILRIVGTDRFISLGELATHQSKLTDLPVGDQNPQGCVGELTFKGKHTTFPNGAYVIEIELDPKTGQVFIDRITGVDDLGRVVNQASAAGQIMGGLAQAAGEVLMERVIYNDYGQPLTGSLMDYAIPRADELTSFNLFWLPTSSPNSLLDVKGVGELSSIGGPGPILNAVHDALRHFEIKHIDMPLTPNRILTAINNQNMKMAGS